MTKPTLPDLKERADSVYQSYTANFAGKPRPTRDLDLLGRLIGDLRGVVDDARTLMNGDRNPAVLAFIETATENLARYENEREMITQAQRDPLTVEAARLASRANRIFDTYRRHFAGRDRSTRDRMLLHELTVELEELERRMKSLLEQGSQSTRADLDTVTQQLSLYRQEVTNIARAQTVGTPEEVGSRLAQLANAQFQLYRDHFAGKSRLSRRPGLLARMIANLEEYQEEMRELRDEGYRSDANDRNIDTIQQNLTLYRTELVEIEKARAEAPVRDLAGALGGAANDVFAEYREHFAGKERRTRDLNLMTKLCDQLRDISLQMRDIDDEIELDINASNLAIVEERWATYEEEYRRIEEAQQNG